MRMRPYPANIGGRDPRIDRPSRLDRIFRLNEDSYSQSVSVSSNPMGQAQMGKSTGTTQNLQKAEDALRQMLLTEPQGSVLSKIVNKFLVDIIPYRKSP